MICAGGLFPNGGGKGQLTEGVEKVVIDEPDHKSDQIRVSQHLDVRKMEYRWSLMRGKDTNRSNWKDEK
jgi:hypothetical protein